jgi:NAD(P)-dependent dehydrogenase (short-subunit alcohol dehydrogenase family)
MSATVDGLELLRAGLLEGVSIVLARASTAGGASLGDGVEAGCAALGARVSVLELAAAGAGPEDPSGADGVLERAVDDVGPIDLLLVDAASVFAAAACARSALGGCLQESWRVTQAVVGRAFLRREQGGRVVYLAPPGEAPGAREADGGAEHADAARAGLENLSRTLSIEWARHGITAMTIAPARTTAAGEVAALTAYFASPAGAYFSGCLLDLRGVAAAR